MAKRFWQRYAYLMISCLVEAVIENFEAEFLLVQLNRLELLDVDSDFTSFHGCEVLVKY